MIEITTEKRRKLVEAVVGNDDLLMEILLRLPTESLCRFKCVSKHWYSFISSSISDPKFCSNHTQMNNKSSLFGVYYYFHRWELLERVKSISLREPHRSLPTLTFLNHIYNNNSSKPNNSEPNNPEPVILHASEGLFLCWFGDGKPLVICNVTTQKSNQLPLHIPPSSFDYHGERAAYLDFNPIKSLHYKVVLIEMYNGQGDFIYYSNNDRREENCSEHDGRCYEIDIYSSESKNWKRKHFRGNPGSDSDYKVLWNGAIHWFSRYDVHMRFEIETETLIANPISPKPEILEENMTRYFGECSGRFFLIQIVQHDCKYFYILEMDKSFCWNVAYKVNMVPLRNYFDEIFKSPDPMGDHGEEFISWKFSVLCTVKKEEMDDLSLLLALPGKIIHL